MRKRKFKSRKLQQKRRRVRARQRAAVLAAKTAKHALKFENEAAPVRTGAVLF